MLPCDALGCTPIVTPAIGCCYGRLLRSGGQHRVSGERPVALVHDKGGVAHPGADRDLALGQALGVQPKHFSRLSHR
jgi:hypothetical protein